MPYGFNNDKGKYIVCENRKHVLTYTTANYWRELAAGLYNYISTKLDNIDSVVFEYANSKTIYRPIKLESGSSTRIILSSGMTIEFNMPSVTTGDIWYPKATIEYLYLYSNPNNPAIIRRFINVVYAADGTYSLSKSAIRSDSKLSGNVTVNIYYRDNVKVDV